MHNDPQQAPNYPTNQGSQPYDQSYYQLSQNPPAAGPTTASVQQQTTPIPLPQQPQPQTTPIVQQAPSEVEMDKAWVDRAVVLLDKTREDPFLQSQEVARLKAQYMQSRFEKEIKVAQEQK